MTRNLLRPALLLIIFLAACNLPAGSRGPETNGTASPEPLSTPQATSTQPAVPLPAPSLPVVVPEALIQIDFLDPYNGWGMAVDGSGMILRSVDGGSTWFDATPPGGLLIGYSSTLSVLDAVHAWLLLPNEDFFTGTLYRSADGGLTWSSVPVPFGGGFLQFLDASTGRLLADRGAAAGSQGVELYQTSDGGATWISVFHNNPTQEGSGDSLPFSGIKDGMTLLDADTGFVTGSRPMPGDIYLFVTRDGGGSWSQQNLPLPPGYETYQYVTSAPVFFGASGCLPLLVYPPDGSPYLTFYTSSDGGVRWSGDPSDANRIINPAPYSFMDASRGYAWDGGRIFYWTDNGARTWGGLAPSLDLSGRLSQLDFSAIDDGLVLTSVDAGGHSQLYHTTDGGFTWTPLIP